MWRAWIFACLIFCSRPAAAGIEAVNVFEPRTFGYFIGDTLERDVEVITSGNTELFTAALPRPGPLTYWLDLVAIDHTVRDIGERKIYDIKLKYQIFYSAIEATNLNIPAFPLKFKNPEGPVPDAAARGEPADAQPIYSASVPALQLTISPIRNIVLNDLMPEKTKELSDILRPDLPAQEIPTGSKERLVFASAGLLFASVALLFWHYALWPFNTRAGRPFTHAERQIRKLISYGAGDPTYREALLILHRAFDDAAGYRLFGEDTGRFIDAHPRFRGFASRVRAFFESSRLYFFSDDRRSAEQNFPLENVRKLADDLAREERAAA